VFRRSLFIACGLVALSTAATAQTSYPSPTFKTVITPADPRYYGAKCDGTTNDTTALQAWAAAITDGAAVRVPGKCLTSAPIVFPVVDHVSFSGDGPGASKLIYSGANTTVTPFTFGAVGAPCGINQWRISDLGFDSTVQMTAGDMVKISGLCDSEIVSITVGGEFGGTKNPFNGLHLNGGNSVKVRGINLVGHGGGDGLIVNGSSTSTTGALTDPFFSHVKIDGFNHGINIAGNVAGFTMDGSDILQNNNNVRISQDQVAAGNYQIFFGPTTFLDITYAGPEIDIAEAGNTVPWLVLDGTWLASSSGGHCLNVQSMSNYRITMHGGFIFNCGNGAGNWDGVHNASLNGQIRLIGTVIASNTGYGVNSTVGNTGIVITGPVVYSNTLGNFSSPNVAPLNYVISPLDGTFYMRNAAMQSPNPILKWMASGSQPADQHNWDATTDASGNLTFRSVSDDYTNASNFMQFIRGTGYSLTGAKVTFPAPVNAIGFQSSGVAGFTGTKTAGSCVLTISGGIITNVTGC
jgi:hypothetical protein